MPIEKVLIAIFVGTSVPWCFAQSSSDFSAYDTAYPANLTGPGAEAVPTNVSDGWHFPRPLFNAPATYPQVFRAVSCGSQPSQYIGVGYKRLYTPEGGQDYAVQLSFLTAYPNNITGTGAGSMQSVFTLQYNTFLNLRTGVVSALNFSEVNVSPSVYTFNVTIDGQIAQEATGRADSTVYSTVHSIDRDAFFGMADNSDGRGGLRYYQYGPPAYNSVDANDTGSKLENEFFWTQNVELLRFYTGFVAMQATTGSLCNPNTLGFYELAPLLDYLTMILKTATNRTDFSEYTAHYLGQLNTTYVQSNPAVGPQIFATLKTPSVFIPFDEPIADPFVGLTESQCIVAAKNASLAANANNTIPANVWNYCSSGVCNYTMTNGTSFTFVSPYAGSHTNSICQLGYSTAVDNNEYVEPAYLTGLGQGTAGRFHPDRPTIIPSTGIIRTSNSTFVGQSESTGEVDTQEGFPFQAGASNA